MAVATRTRRLEHPMLTISIIAAVAAVIYLIVAIVRPERF
jgi:K+-transporting ATPase KdpF subunit